MNEKYKIRWKKAKKNVKNRESVEKWCNLMQWNARKCKILQCVLKNEKGEISLFFMILRLIFWKCSKVFKKCSRIFISSILNSLRTGLEWTRKGYIFKFFKGFIKLHIHKKGTVLGCSKVFKLLF